MSPYGAPFPAGQPSQFGFGNGYLARRRARHRQTVALNEVEQSETVQPEGSRRLSHFKELDLQLQKNFTLHSVVDPSSMVLNATVNQVDAERLRLGMKATVRIDAYPDVEKGFSDEALKSRGWNVEVREPLTLKDGKGFFIVGPQESNGQKRYESAMVAQMGGITSIVSERSERPEVAAASCSSAIRSASWAIDVICGVCAVVLS